MKKNLFNVAVLFVIIDLAAAATIIQGNAVILYIPVVILSVWLLSRLS